ncbi:hypothetical protein ASV59_03380 [Pseudomonas aeruginosa 0C2E]|nr:hypothetical protein AN448_03265 [Pseudomonas aeruginosa]KUI89761.1 hypothetical protein ASV59_03380 [Pseudomonas aeruginosa 0C2E]KXF36242.1 hypothetical protein AW939_29195 [Pseudomonas aeruginosa]CRQ95247.1 hypothetical protein PAERUG_E15_London_28_01_14_07123 [Pseudomonas aeruginosa]
MLMTYIWHAIEYSEHRSTTWKLFTSRRKSLSIVIYWSLTRSHLPYRAEEHNVVALNKLRFWSIHYLLYATCRKLSQNGVIANTRNNPTSYYLPL